MAKKEIYKITVRNWEKYNGRLKKGHKCILLSTGFLTDPKIMTLSLGGMRLYLGLLLRCGDLTSSSIEASYDLLVTLAGGSGQVVDRLMRQLESLQLVTYEKSAPFLNRIEEKRIEKKRREGTASKNLPSPSAAAPTIIPFYCEQWKKRYGTSPPINGRAAGQLTRLAKDLSQEKAEKLIHAYLQMPDSWFVTKRHDVSTLVMNLNSVAQFMDTGKMVTKAHLQELNEMVDDKMGPKPRGIEQILSEKKQKEISP